MRTCAAKSVRWAALCLLALAATSCDALNPAFVGQLGGDAGNVGPAPGGSIVLIFNNQTGRDLTLLYDVEYTRAGESTVIQENNRLTTGNGYWSTTFDCNVSGLLLTGIVPLVVDEDDQTPDDAIPLAVNTFRRPALQCGSVIFVNMPLLGSPTADLLP